MSKISPQSTLKAINKKSIVSELLYTGPLSRADIAIRLNSTKTTVSKNTNELVENKFLIEVGKGQNNLGKKSTLLDINPDIFHYVFINLAGNFFSIYVIDLKGEVLLKKEVPIFNKYDINNIIEETINHYSNKELLKKIVLSIPAVVNGNEIISNLQIYKDIFNIVVEIANQRELNLLVFNDVHLYGEYLNYVSQDNASFIVVGANHGIGSSIFINGEIYKGTSNFAGEIAYCNPKLVDGKIEDLEYRCSISGMIEMYAKEKGVKLSKSDFKLEVSKGNTILESYLEKAIEEIANQIYNISYILDINDFYFTGELFDLKPTIVDDLKNKIFNNDEKTINVFKTSEDDYSLKGVILVMKKETLNLI